MTGEELKTKRKLQGWTQSHLAQKIGVSKGTIINYEKGKKIPESKSKILQEVFVGRAVRNYTPSPKRNELKEDSKGYNKPKKAPSQPLLDQVLSKFHPVEIVAYLDRHRDLYFNLEEFKLLTKNIVDTNDLEQLKEDIRTIRKKLDANHKG